MLAPVGGQRSSPRCRWRQSRSSARATSLTTIASSRLRVELVATVGDRPLTRLGGEPDQYLTGPAPRREACRARRSSARARASAGGLDAGLLELARGRVARAEVGDRGSHQQHVGGVKAGLARVQQLGRGLHRDRCGRRRAPAATRWRRRRSPRRRERPRPMRARAPSGPTSGCRCSGRGSIGSRVPPAVTSTRTPRQAAAVAFGAGQRGLARGRQLVGLGHPPESTLAMGGELAGVGPTIWIPRARSSARLSWVAGVTVHPVVHRRRDQDRAVGGERRRRDEVVGQAVRELGDRVRARRRDQVHVGTLHEREVGDRGAARGGGFARIGAAQRIVIELAGQHRRAGDPGERLLLRRSAGVRRSGSRAPRGRQRSAAARPGRTYRRRCRR